MRVIYVADIHGAFDRVRQLLDETDADVYIIAGDLIDLPFYTMNTAMHYHDLQTFFHVLRRRMAKTSVLLEDFVDQLMVQPELGEEIQEKGSRFQQYTIRARRVMQQKYKVLENILSLKSGPSCFCLPGNYDMDLRYTSLHHRDLHLQCHTVGSLKIGGYGGASGWTQGIPERYVIQGRSDRTFSERDREMTHFFEEAQPDLIVTHQPAHGFHDQVTPMGPTGSPALLNYCETHEVQACLTGHIHEQWGFAESDGTIYLNPSNFGALSQISGRVSEGGFFHEIEVRNNRIERVTYKKIAARAIHDIMVYSRQADNWQSRVVDHERFGAHLRGQPYDRQTGDTHHPPADEWPGDIHAFYRPSPVDKNQCEDSPMEQAIRLMEAGGPFLFALDIVGSERDGFSYSGSDIDLVVYLRCEKADEEKVCFRGASSDCPEFAAAQDMIRDRIGKRAAFTIVDCIDLNHVEKSIRIKNYECEMTQRFVVYRSVGRLVQASLIAPVEELLNRDKEFRQELEGSIRSYFRIFMATAGHVRSFAKYESQLNAIGIRLPQAMRSRVRAYLERQDS